MIILTRNDKKTTGWLKFRINLFPVYSPKKLTIKTRARKYRLRESNEYTRKEVEICDRYSQPKVFKEPKPYDKAVETFSRYRRPVKVVEALWLWWQSGVVVRISGKNVSWTTFENTIRIKCKPAKNFGWLFYRWPVHNGL